MLYKWADKIIALDIDIFIKLDRETDHSNKTLVVDVGNDTWHNAKDQALTHKLYKELSKHPELWGKEELH